MSATEINHLLKLFTILQLFLFAFFLVTHKKVRKQPHVMLGLFLAANGMWYAGNLGGGVGAFMASYIKELCWGFSFIIGPSLYFYGRSLVNPVFKLKKQHAVHGICFIIFALLPNLPGTVQVFGEHGVKPFFGIIKYLHVGVYSAAVWVVLKRHRAAVKNLFSTLQKKELAWLNFLVIGFLVVYGLFFLHYLGHVDTRVFFVPPTIPILLFFLLANFLIYNALKQPEVFAGAGEADDKNVPAPPGSKYAKTKLPDDMAAEFEEKLTGFMEKEKPYLDPLLNLTGLARQSAIPAHYISQIINTRFRHNFYHFINQYRVKESMRLLSELSESPGKKQTVVEIMYASGFNSKSVFNTAFKKYTGMTPTQFVKQSGL